MSLSFSTRNYSEFYAILFCCYQSGKFSSTAESVVTWTRIIINFIGLFIELSCNTDTHKHTHYLRDVFGQIFGPNRKNKKYTKKTDDNSSLRANRGASASCIDYLQQQQQHHRSWAEGVCECVCVSSIDARCVNNLISSNTRYMIQDIKTNLVLSLSLSMNCEFRLRFEYRICMQPAAATVISIHCE